MKLKYTVTLYDICVAFIVMIVMFPLAVAIVSLLWYCVVTLLFTFLL